MKKLEKLTTSESLALDVVRVTAAVVVAIGHITLWYFSVGLPDLVLVGRGAVVIFFVLSGFVIRYVTVSKPGTMADFLKDRASRIYSVAIPAMLLTIIADSISHWINPGFYTSWNMSGLSKVLGISGNLLWTAQLWTRFDDPLSNSPFWSLNYEVIYYVVYAVAFYLSGTRRWVWIAVVSLIAGPKIMLLFPVWLLGCAAHDIYQRWHRNKQLIVYLNYACSALAVLLLVLAVDRKLAHQAMAFYMIFYREGRALSLGRTSGVIDFYAVGLVGSVFLLRLLLAIRGIQINARGKSSSRIRFIAEGTFAIYLTHFPLFVLIAATIPYNHSSLWQKAVMLVAVVTFGVLMGQGCKTLKTRLRSMKLPLLNVVHERVL